MPQKEAPFSFWERVMAARTSEISTLVSASNPTSQALTGYIRESDLAAELRVSLRTLRRWDERRIGPARTQIGRAIYYSRASIDSWLLARTVKPCCAARGRRVA